MANGKSSPSPRPSPSGRGRIAVRLSGVWMVWVFVMGLCGWRGFRGDTAFGGAGVEVFGFHDVGNVDGTFAFDDCALGVLLALAHVFFDHARAFDDNALLFCDDGDDAAALAFIGASDDHD